MHLRAVDSQILLRIGLLAAIVPPRMRLLGFVAMRKQFFLVDFHQPAFSSDFPVPFGDREGKGATSG